jgi:hypothetical protein
MRTELDGGRLAAFQSSSIMSIIMSIIACQTKPLRPLFLGGERFSDASKFLAQAAGGLVSRDQPYTITSMQRASCELRFS